MADARADFLLHKEKALAAKREGRLDEARAEFLAAAKSLLGLAEQVRSPEEKASLLETAQALFAKAKELRPTLGTAGDAAADLVDIESVTEEAPQAAPPQPPPVRPAAIDPTAFLASAPGQAMRAQILSAIAATLPLSPAVDLAALAAETNGMAGPDLLALLAEACRRAQRACVKGRAEWQVEPEDIASALASREAAPASREAAPASREAALASREAALASREAVLAGRSAPEPVDTPKVPPPRPPIDPRVQETLTQHGLPPDEAAAFDDLLHLTEDRQLLSELLVDRAREVKVRLAKRQALEILKPYTETLDRAVFDHLLAQVLSDPLAVDPAQLAADLKALVEGGGGEKRRELAKRLVEAYRGTLPPEELAPFETRAGEDGVDLAGLKTELEGKASRVRFERFVDGAVEGMTDLSPALRRKLQRKAKRLLTPSNDAGTVRTDLRKLRDRLVAFYEGQKPKEGEEQKDPIANVEDLILEVCPVDYDDVAGMQAIKRAMEFAIESPLRDHEVILRATGRPPENTGILLYGPPGCGKTFIALAAAGEFREKYGVTVISVPLEAVLALHWSKQVERIVDIFELARRKAPAIVIWDEFDTYASDPRVTGRKYDEKLCTTFKQQFEGVMKSEKPIIHIATSNYPWKLEIPLLRPGRLGDIKYIPPPDAPARRELFEVLLAGANVEQGLALEELSAATEGAVSAEIKAIARKALEAPVKDYIDRGRKDPLRKATMEDLRAALKEQNVGQFPAWLRLAEQEIGKERFLPVQPLFQALKGELDKYLGAAGR